VGREYLIIEMVGYGRPLGVVDNVRQGETTGDAMDRVYTFVENQVIQKVKDAKESLLED
jgi:hypothetical protein